MADLTNPTKCGKIGHLGNLTDSAGCGKIVVVGDRVEFQWVPPLGGRPRSSPFCYIHGDIVEWRKPNLNMCAPIGLVKQFAGSTKRYIVIPLPDP